MLSCGAQHLIGHRFGGGRTFRLLGPEKNSAPKSRFQQQWGPRMDISLGYSVICIQRQWSLGVFKNRVYPPWQFDSGNDDETCSKGWSLVSRATGSHRGTTARNGDSHHEKMGWSRDDGERRGEPWFEGEELISFRLSSVICQFFSPKWKSKQQK